jgi:hypothetical protein
VFALEKTADAERVRLNQRQTAAMTKKQRRQSTRGRSHRAWVYPEDEELEADSFWRQRNGEAVYYSRGQRSGQRQDERYNGCAAAAAAGGGLGEPVTASEVRAPHGCEPMHKLHKPVVALKEALS